MDFDLPMQQRSPTPSNWLDMLHSNSVCFDDLNNPATNNGSGNLENSKIFNGDISMFGLPDINMLMDVNVENKFKLENDFDNDKLLDDLNASLEPIPQDFFLAKELSSQFSKLNDENGKEAIENPDISKSNQKMVNDLKATVYNNENFKRQLVDSMDGFVSPQLDNRGHMLSQDDEYFMNNNTQTGLKFASEARINNKSKSGTGSPLRNNASKYSMLEKYINVSEDEDDDENEDQKFDNMNFGFQTSPVRQPANQGDYYKNGGSSPVASTNYINQDSPVRKGKSSHNHISSANNNLSFFDVPQLQFTDSSFQYELENNSGSNSAYPQSQMYSQATANSNMSSSYLQKQQHNHQQSDAHQNNSYFDYGLYQQNQQNQYNTAAQQKYFTKPSPAGLNNSNQTMLSNSTTDVNSSTARNPTEQRLKSYNSVGTSQSTILEEPSPYQQQISAFGSAQQQYQRIVSGTDSHASSVQKKHLGLGLSIKTIKEEQGLALNDALMRNNDENNGNFAAANGNFAGDYMRDDGIRENLGLKEPTKKLSKFETPQLQQVPFFSNSHPDISGSSPTIGNNSLVSCQYVKIQSPSQEKPLIGMINRSPKGVRKKSTLPPGTIDQYIAELSDKTFICLFNDCQRKFPRRYNIRAHVQTHLQDKPHSCDVCGNSFVRNHDLVRHKKTHMEKKFGCTCCGKMFLTEKLLAQHEESKKCTTAHGNIIQSTSLEAGSDVGIAKTKIGKTIIEFGTQTASKSGRVTKPVSPKKQQQQSSEKTETSLEFKNTMTAVSNINKVVKKDIYHFNSVNF